MRNMIWLLLFIVVLVSGSAFAVEVAPRISDREIVDRLIRLEEGQRSMQRQMDDRFSAMQKQMDNRFSAMERQVDNRFSAMERQVDDRFSAMEKQVDNRFSAMEKRMELMEQWISERMEAQWHLTLVLIAAILGLVGFVVWDRSTALKPLERRFDRIADDLELESPGGSKLTRLVGALRELAPEDRRLADVLRRFSLLKDLPRQA